MGRHRRAQHGGGGGGVVGGGGGERHRGTRENVVQKEQREDERLRNAERGHDPDTSSSSTSVIATANPPLSTASSLVMNKTHARDANMWLSWVRAGVAVLDEGASGETLQLMQRALLVWALFAILSLAPVPETLVPLLSHAVGFGFYLVMVTRQSRWMLMVVVASCALISITARALPPEMYPFATYAVAACALLLSLALAAVFGRQHHDSCSDLFESMTKSTNGGIVPKNSTPESDRNGGRAFEEDEDDGRELRRRRRRCEKCGGGGGENENGEVEEGILVDLGVAVDLDRVECSSGTCEHMRGVILLKEELEERVRELESERGVRTALEADLVSTRARLEAMERSKREADVSREWYVRALKTEEKSKRKVQRELQEAHSVELRRLSAQHEQSAHELKLAREQLAHARASPKTPSPGHVSSSPSRMYSSSGHVSSTASRQVSLNEHVSGSNSRQFGGIRHVSYCGTRSDGSPSLNEYKRLERELEERVRDQRKLQEIAAKNEQEVHRQRSLIERLSEGYCDKLVETMTESLVSDE